MIGFFTSSPTGPLDNSYTVDGMDHKNKFVECLRQYYKSYSKVLMIASNPYDYARNDDAKGFFKWSLEHCGLNVSAFDFLDERTLYLNPNDYDVIYLSGGHVPTQHAFFERIHLRDKLKDYQGIVIGISAGTMNSADIVYCQPEESGESREDFVRFFQGLGLCKTQILPHFQMIRYFELDGRRLIEDITFKDSNGHHFLCLEDGSYLFVKDEKEYVCGKAYHIYDGKLEDYCEENEKREVDF